eukprot:3008532-Pleurochrysis_carterae.AAC.1
MASVRAHERRVALRNEKQAFADVRRASRPCEGKRTHRIINLPEGASKRPYKAAMHEAIA